MTRAEALQAIKARMDYYESDKRLRCAIETIIPELTESEDERIRKALIEVFKKKLEKGFEWVEYGIPNRSVLDWLEKQKEQRPVDYEAELKKCKDNPLYFYDKYVSIKQKPAEWSEEDEKKIIFLERLIEHNVPDGQYGWVDGMKGGFVTKSEAISMLKSLRPSWKPSEVCYGPKGDPDPAGTSDLEEAADEYVSKTLCDPNDGPSTGLAKGGFIAGAEWMRKKDVEDMYMSDNRHFIKCYKQGKVDMKVEMMKEVKYGVVCKNGERDKEDVWIELNPGSLPDYKDTDPIDFIIVKQDDRPRD